MSALLDLRRIRVGIEVNGNINYYEDLKVKASGTKYANQTQNEAVITITGLNEETRDYILTETSPFNANRTPKRVIVQVGRVSTGLFTLYMGDIITTEAAAPPDLDITIKAKTQNAQSGNIVSTSAGAQTKLSALANRVATDLGVALTFQAQDKNIGNYQHTGSALAQVGKLAQAGGVQAYIDDGMLVVKDVQASLTGQLIILNKDSGMVGIPKPNEKGLTVTFLITPQAKIGGMLRIESQINKSLNGDYIINQLKFDAQNYDTPFYYTAEAVRA